ncbi:MAG: amino acid ABC transporter permease [Lachnospiraceae bacterium]|nr:amino acid ABC transporter permease [Lachnospiraceae bacterium]
MKLNTEFMRETFIASLGGIPKTMLITILTLLVSIPIAFAMALSKLENKKVSSKFVTAYVSFIRGTPIVLQILFIYSLLPSTLNHLIKDVLGLSVNVFKMNKIVYAIIVFSLNNIAVLTELFRSALGTVGHGQMEAAMTVGLTKRQAYRRIIIPQALVAALPNLCNTVIGLIKNTSLAFLMAVQEITAISKMKAAAGYYYIEAYLMIALIYIIVCTVVQLLFALIEYQLSAYKKRLAV